MKKYMMSKIEIHRLFTVLVHYGVRCRLPQKPCTGNSAWGVCFLILGFQVRFPIQILAKHDIFLPAYKQEFDTFKEFSLMCTAPPPHFFFALFFARETSGKEGEGSMPRAARRDRGSVNTIAQLKKENKFANLKWEKGEQTIHFIRIRSQRNSRSSFLPTVLFPSFHLSYFQSVQAISTY